MLTFKLLSTNIYKLRLKNIELKFFVSYLKNIFWCQWSQFIYRSINVCIKVINTYKNKKNYFNPTYIREKSIK